MDKAGSGGVKLRTNTIVTEIDYIDSCIEVSCGVRFTGAASSTH